MKHSAHIFLTCIFGHLNLSVENQTIQNFLSNQYEENPVLFINYIRKQTIEIKKNSKK
jgi:hypothetical protein